MTIEKTQQKNDWRFNKEISINQLISVIVLIISLLSIVFTLIKRIDHNEIAVKHLLTAHNKNEVHIKEIRSELRNEVRLMRQQIYSQLHTVTTKLDHFIARKKIP